MKKTQIFLDRKLREQRIPPFRIRQNSTILDQFIIFDAVRRCFWSRLWIRICLNLLFICTTQPSATYLQLSIHPLPAQPSEPALSVHCVCAANLSQSSTQPVKAVIPIPQAHVSPFQPAILTYCVENKMWEIQPILLQIITNFDSHFWNSFWETCSKTPKIEGWRKTRNMIGPRLCFRKKNTHFVLN